MSDEVKSECWFRFESLSESQVRALRQHCGSVEVRPIGNVPDRFVASFQFDPVEKYDWLESFVRVGNISDSEYGVFVYVESTHPTPIVELPPFVVELYRRIGGRMEFSFTIL